MTVSNELIDQLLAGYKKPEDLIGENGLLKQLTKRLVERALEAEMTKHLGHPKNASVANPGGNACNGKSKKTLKGDFDEQPMKKGNMLSHVSFADSRFVSLDGQVSAPEVRPFPYYGSGSNFSSDKGTTFSSRVILNSVFGPSHLSQMRLISPDLSNASKASFTFASNWGSSFFIPTPMG